ncbi:MAG: glycerophosphodiester phosphodiesterase family protein [Ignavibacteria bacterium]|nr:glycerophosphodiester phosphodiesterase family protein [Ignavibacteria bacterium]
MLTLMQAYERFDYFVVAHRGASGVAPENTLSSFEEAIRSGAHFIEMDIQVTSDAIPIVFHDKGLSRTTNGIGLASKLSYQELKKLDSGAWFSREFQGERIPSLEEVLQFLTNKVLLNIELKNLGETPNFHIQNILNLIMKYRYSDRVVISSFYYNQLKIVKELAPEIPIAAIRLPKDNTFPSRLKKEIGCEGFVCSVEELNKELTEDAQKNNIFLGVYSVDNEEQLDYVLQFGVKAIVTNHPKLVLDILRNKYKARV